MEFAILSKQGIDSSPTFLAVKQVADHLRYQLDLEQTQTLIRERHVLGASSHVIQEVVLRGASDLGFESERKGLFADYEVSALRPDYYRPIGETGILLEVERGKTITNNMDLLDLWKCHICPHARFLFLIVPQFRPSSNGSSMRHFSHVIKRLSPFFVPRNYVNVDAVFVFGY